MWGVVGMACVAEEASASGWPVVDSGDAGGAGVEVEVGRFPLGFVACSFGCCFGLLPSL